MKMSKTKLVMLMSVLWISVVVGRDPVNFAPLDNQPKFKVSQNLTEFPFSKALPIRSVPSEKTQLPVVPAFLTPIEYQLFSKSLNFLKGEQCKIDLNSTLSAIVGGEHWAVALYDATQKSAVGVENGVLYQLGHYDECLHQWKSFLNEIPVQTKYCLADVPFNLTESNIANLSSRKMSSGETTVRWGACVPASCNDDDAEIFLRLLLKRAVTVNENACQTRVQEVFITEPMLVYAAIVLFFVLLAVLSTIYHIYSIYTSHREKSIGKVTTRNEVLKMTLLSCSIIENTKKIFQASKKDRFGLNAINGIKSIAMLLILAGHALSFIYGGPVYNMEFFNRNVKMPTFGFLTNSLLFVDTFLLLSGFLFCRIFLLELEERRGRINVIILYVARYIRLTPAYAVIIGFYMTWFPYVGNGPLWPERIGREQERCMSSWWLNILYINNYFKTDKLCMFQSWYLSVDTQLFILAPISIYLLYYSRKYGIRLLVLLATLTSMIPFVVTFLQGLDPTLLVYADEISDLGSNVFYIGSYIKTHMRASAYAVGLITGFTVHYMQEKDLKLPNYLMRLGWTVAVLIGVGSMFSVYRFYINSFTEVESILYAGFHKLGWNLSVAWLVFAVTTDHSGWLYGLLSHRVFAPISRLTYCAYLSNGIVELYHSSTIRNAGYMSYINLINDVVGHVNDTLILAFLLCMVFESPIHSMERILLRTLDRKSSSVSDTTERTTDSPLQSTMNEQLA